MKSYCRFRAITTIVHAVLCAIRDWGAVIGDRALAWPWVWAVAYSTVLHLVELEGIVYDIFGYRDANCYVVYVEYANYTVTTSPTVRNLYLCAINHLNAFTVLYVTNTCLNVKTPFLSACILDPSGSALRGHQPLRGCIPTAPVAPPRTGPKRPASSVQGWSMGFPSRSSGLT